MLLSQDRRFIFIHIQKTGGSSITEALEAVAPDAVRRFFDLPACRDPLKSKHLFASDLKPYLGNEEWRRYFKFAFVRNPWSRLVSWYNMCIERPSNPFMKYVKRNAGTFEDFLNLTSGLAAKTVFNQLDYISDENGALLIDFVGKFETIAADFASVCQRLDISIPLQRRHAGTAVDYRSYYNARTRQLVEDRFHRDIAAFGYQFD
jgi:chondroitin 4-sulfotransferase 11